MVCMELNSYTSMLTLDEWTWTETEDLFSDHTRCGNQLEQMQYPAVCVISYIILQCVVFRKLQGKENQKKSENIKSAANLQVRRELIYEGKRVERNFLAPRKGIQPPFHLIKNFSKLIYPEKFKIVRLILPLGNMKIWNNGCSWQLFVLHDFPKYFSSHPEFLC